MQNASGFFYALNFNSCAGSFYFKANLTLQKNILSVHF